MSASEHTEERGVNKDLRYISILVAIALVIGVYLIVTTVLIAKDGVGYIERAQQLQTNPLTAIKRHPPGYPFLILAAHKLSSIFTHDNSNQAWIYSAQSVTLLCRLLALIPLYFIGRQFVGSKQSFWAMLILIILPYPAQMGSDVIRQWPYLLFLASGLLALLYGARSSKWWLFAVAGIIAGLGHTIRPECAQIVLFGFAWLLFRFWRPVTDFGRLRCVLAILVMTAGLGAVVSPYMTIRNQVLPEKLYDMVTFNESSEANVNNESDQLCITAFAGDRYLRGIGKLSDRICQHLMYFFVPPLLIGLYLRFRKVTDVNSIERVLILGLAGLYILMMMLLYRDYDYISRRHCLPLVVFTIFYLPEGIKAMAQWWCDKTKKNSISDVRRMTVILFAIGMGICLPKLLGNKSRKTGYVAAAKWINSNTAENAVVVTPDPRISFYADRKGMRPKNVMDLLGEYYLVEIVEDEKLDANAFFWVDEERKKKRIVVYHKGKE